MDRVKFFYDTEFLDGGKTIDLISIGIVRPQQTVFMSSPENDFRKGDVELPHREYYAVAADMPWRKVMKHQWLCKNVVPYLPIVERPFPSNSIALNKNSRLVKPKSQIAHEVWKFLTLTMPEDSGDTDTIRPVLYAWYSAYDHVALMQLWGSMMDRPHRVPMYTIDLKVEAVRQEKSESELPQQVIKEHHALEDARHNVEIAKALGVL